MHKLALLAAVVLFVLHAAGVGDAALVDWGFVALAAGLLLKEVDLNNCC